MSTKTTFKRVALVAVAALGFGILSSVAPASAATDTDADVPVAAVATLTNTTLTYAGRVGQQVSIPVTGTVGAVVVGTANIGVLSIATAITSQPATSAIYPTITTAAVPTGYTQTGSGRNYGAAGVTTTVGAGALSLAGDATTVATVNYAAASAGAVAVITTATTALATVTFTPTVAGVYTIAVWNENDRVVSKATTDGFAMFAAANAALSGSESYKTFTINVGSSSAATVTLTGFGTTAATGGTSGSLVKVSLKDAAGNITIPATGETVTLTPSGSGVISKVNDAPVTSAAGAAYNLSAADFGQTGTAWVNVTAATEQALTVTATISGSSSAAIALSFKTVTATATSSPLPYSSTATGYAAYTASNAIAASVPLGTTTTTYSSPGAYSTTTPVYHSYVVTDTSGKVTGVANLDWEGAAAVGSTLSSFYSVTTTSVVDAQQYTIANSVGTTTTSSAAVSTGVLTLTPATINATSGSSVTITGTLKDTFGRALASTVVTASVTGRNPTTVSQSVVTDALGNYSFVIADANTTSILTSDSVTVASAQASTPAKIATILYGTANAAAKVVVSSDDYTDGVANNSVAAQPIVASTTYLTGKAGAEAGKKTITAVITNAAGAILAGVPVKWSVSGTTAAILSTTATTYTDNTGKATTSVYAWATGTYTVTATAGAVTGTATETFAQSTAASARTISATVAGGVVTAMAKDRFGNAVSGVKIYAKIDSGSGFFGTGVLSTFADTDTTGTAKFVVSGGSASVTVSNISFSDPAGTVVGQTGAAAGKDIGGVDATTFGASVAGTATVAEYGVGSSFSAAGVASATVAVEITNASETAADAAAEATDAANAATDAANAAAEAADAATAAAQDAADAVAALSTQVSEMVAALKKQITALTNLVIKIQKKVKA